MKLTLERIIPIVILFAIISSVFLFLVSVSKYPAGDDPGYHTSILRYLINNEDIHFSLPFFPQIGTPYGEERFVTNIFLTVVSKITGIYDVFVLTIYFAAFCLSASLLFVYFIIHDWTRSNIIALLSIMFLGFSKWYQENFWEGSYDQYTGLFILSAIIFLLYRWNQNKRLIYLGVSVFLIAVLYKTHELGFLIALSLFSISFILHLKHAGRIWLYYAVMIGYFGAVFLLYYLYQPGYFAISDTGYLVPKMLGVGEGTPQIAFNVILLGFIFLLLFTRNVLLFAWLGITYIFSQSFLFGVPFYAYRFNVYFIQAGAILFASALYFILRFIRSYQIHRYARLTIIFAGVAVIFPFQFIYINGLSSWIVSQERNPASVILKEDMEAFRWIKDHTPKDAIILAPLKWGYYLPAIAERSVVLNDAVGGDQRDNRWNIAKIGTEIYTTTSAHIAQSRAKEIGVKYILWDASIFRFPYRYGGYQRVKFENMRSFSKVYEKNNVYIYEVL